MNIMEESKRIGQLWKGFWHARVLLTANNLSVFEHLKDKKSAAELAPILGADARALAILLDALAGMELVKKSGSRYRNTAGANKLLVGSSPLYQGDILRHGDALWKKWSGLDEIVKTGLPSDIPMDYCPFIHGMHNIAVFKAAEVVKKIDLKGVKRAIDVGGGPGTYSIELSKKADSVILFDRPQTIAIAREIVAKSGRGNISFMEGDFLADDPGSGYDLVFISQVVHAYSEKENRLMVEKAAAALAPGGQIVIQEFLIEKDLTRPLPGALFSVNMLVGTSGGRCYAPSEIRGWLKDAGFGRLKHRKMKDTVLVSGRKR